MQRPACSTLHKLLTFPVPEMYCHFVHALLMQFYAWYGTLLSGLSHFLAAVFIQTVHHTTAKCLLAAAA